MKQSKQYTKINSLKAKTTKSVANYKLKLNINNRTNKLVLTNFKAKLVSDLVAGSWPYVILVEIFFSTRNEKLAEFINELRNEGISYFFITQPELRLFTTTKRYPPFWLTELDAGSLLLVVTTDNESIYRTVISLFLELEKSSTENVFNSFQLLCVKEKSSLISFAKCNTAVRALYDVKNTPRVILLETLNALNSALFRVPVMLQTPVDTLRVAPIENFLVSFPFKPI